MPSFSNAQSVLKFDRKLNKVELIRALKFFIASEYEAEQMYMQVAESCDDELAIRVLKSVSDEEKTHAGEFFSVLSKIDEEWDEYYEKGKKEVEKSKKEVGGSEKKDAELKDPEEIKQANLKKLFA